MNAYVAKSVIECNLGTPVEIVDIDEKSLAEEGRWPWRRDRLGVATEIVGSAAALTGALVSGVVSETALAVVLGLVNAVLGPALVALTMVVLTGDIAIALGLLAIFAIVRFRNAIKETRDVAFLFLAMAIGMVVGARLYMVSVIVTPMVAALLYAIASKDAFAPRRASHLLMLRLTSEILMSDRLAAPTSAGLTSVPLGRCSVTGRKQPALVGIVGSVSARTAK